MTTSIMLGAILVYFIPTIIAYARERKDASTVMLVNLLFGVTGVGWAVALIWALKHQENSGKGCHCDHN